MAIAEILHKHSTSDGKLGDGLDIGIGLLAERPAETLECLKAIADAGFLQSRQFASATQYDSDDCLYMLMRGLARSTAPRDQVFPLLRACAIEGNWATREAATHALADFGGEEAVAVLREMLGKAESIAESAREALEDIADGE